MTTFDQKLKEWVVSETTLFSDGRLKLFPETSDFGRLIEGKHKRIWKYLVDHVRSRCAADKVKRVLAVKQHHHELKNPYSFTNADQVLKRIGNAKEKRSFLEGSLSELKKEISDSENKVCKINDEISMINQKSAVLELITTDCKQKCADLNAIKSQLTFYFERNSREDTQFYLSLNFTRAPKNTCSKFNLGNDLDSKKVKYILRQISSLINDSKGCKIPESLTDNFKKHVDKMLHTISIADLFIILKKISNTSYMELMSKETYSSSSEVQTLKLEKRNSEIYLQDVKLDFIQSSFTTKKCKKEILRLEEEREILRKKFVPKIRDAGFEKKLELFEKMAENAGLGASLKFLEDSLELERKEVEELKREFHEEIEKSSNLESVVQNFYASFDTLCMLLKSGTFMHKSIIKYLSNLHKFSNEKMFSSVSCTFNEYPYQIKDNLKFDIHTMWTVLEKNNVINPLIPCLFSINSSVPDILIKMLDVSKFHNECVINCKVKKMKENSAINQVLEFKFDEDVLSAVHQQYISMTEILKKMQDKLELCSGNFHECSEQSKRNQVVMQDWWKQGAQFIPQIEYEGKSLKMWLDILHVLPDL